MGPELLAAIALSVIAAAALALVARTLRQPLILGYILGGVVLGRHLGLGVVSDEASIEVISEIGLIFLLFIIGLEIDVPRVLQAGRTILVLGLLQFPLCAAVTWYALGGAVSGFGGRLDAFYVAVALSLSSTLIVVKLIYDKLEISTFAGKLTLGVLIFQDLWAISFLALQPNLDRLGAGPLLRSLAAVGALVGMAAGLSRYVLPTLFRAIATSHELVLITAIAWCFLVSGVAGQIGLSTEMGALIAGLVLAAFPYGMEVVARLSGIRDFFVTLFFVTLGLKMPVPSTRTVALALVAALVVIATRALTIFPLSALLRLDLRTAGVVAINLSQVSEFSLVIINLGVEQGHVSPDVAGVVLYTLLLTAVLSTYGILYNHQIATGVECMYGDISNTETLHHAGIERATIVVSSISDSFLRGTTNLNLLQVVRSMAPHARIVATAETLADAEKLYGEGAHYVLIPPALAADQLYKLLARPSDAALQAARRRQ